MPRLKKRPDGRYRVKYNGMYFYGTTQREAYEKRDEYVAREKSGLLTADIGFRAYAARWISAYKIDVAQKTYAQYARYLNDAADQLGDPQIASITPTHIQILFRSLAGKSSSYIAKYTSTIRSVMQAAYRDGFIPRDPTVGLHRPAGTSGTHRALEPWEDDILFQLRDDLIDFLSDSREEGKETHKDFRDGIYTMPVLKAMQQDACRQELLPLMRRSLEQDLTPSEIGHMEETVKRYGGVDATRGQIRSMQETCYALLDGLEQNQSVSQLRKLVRYLSI